jgi:acyl carrier protein
VDSERSIRGATAIVAKALKILERNLTVDSAIDNVDEWDSLRHMGVISEIESTIGRSLDIDEILEATSISKIGLIIKASSNDV